MEEKWKEILQIESDPQWMREMLFESEKEVIKYIMETINEQTSEKEIKGIINMINKLLDGKLNTQKSY